MNVLRLDRAPSLLFVVSFAGVAACGGQTSSLADSDDAAADAAGGSNSEGGGDDDSDAGGDDGSTTTYVPDAAAPFGAVQLFSCVPTVYTAPITIGGSQTFELTIDTGSTSLGVASNECTNCDVSPVYTPGATAVNENRTASSQFGTGSWTGSIYQDGVAGGTVPSTPVKLVAIDSQSGFFESIRCDSTNRATQGILGLGPAAVALPGTTGYVDALVANEAMPDIFAIELCDNGGTLWLGSYDASATTAAPQYTPLTTDYLSQEYYTVELTSVSVNGATVPIASAQFADTLVDTGTSVFLLGSTAYSSIVSAIANDAAFAQAFGGASFFANQSCKTTTQTKAELDATLPAMTLTFASGAVVSTLPTESYLFTAGAYTWCPALASQAQSAQEFPFASIFGAPMMRSNITIFDRTARRVGFAPHTACN